MENRLAANNSEGRTWIIAGLAGVATWLGLLAGWNVSLVLLAAIGVPSVVFMLLGRFSTRGVIVGGIAVLLGASTLGAGASPSTIAWADAALLAAMVPVALLGASWADAMAPMPIAKSTERSLEDVPVDPAGQWMTVVVTGRGRAPGSARRHAFPPSPATIRNVGDCPDSSRSHTSSSARARRSEDDEGDYLTSGGQSRTISLVDRTAVGDP